MKDATGVSLNTTEGFETGGALDSFGTVFFVNQENLAASVPRSQSLTTIDCDTKRMAIEVRAVRGIPLADMANEYKYNDQNKRMQYKCE